MKINYKTLLTGGMIAAVLMAAPLSSFAKEKDGKADKKEAGCFKAVGHFIAPGWIKHNGTIYVSVECNLPFGINKKLSGNSNGGSDNGNRATTTPDVTAPVMSAITLSAGETHSEIRWKTDEKSNSTVFWATTTPVVVGASATAESVQKKKFVRDHRIVLKNLAASTTYYVVVRSSDAAGNSTTSSTFAVTTHASADVTAPVISNSSASATGAVSWKTNEPATSKVYYTAAFPISLGATSTQSVEIASFTKDHSVNLTGLNAATKYNLMIESKDVAGNTSTKSDLSLTTGI